MNGDYQKLSDNVRLLGDILGQVIYQQAGPEILGLEERIRRLAKSRRTISDPLTDQELAEIVEQMDVARQEAVARAFTSYFELINLAEEHHRVRVLREREAQADGKVQHESLAEAIATLRKKGVNETHMADLLNRLKIELVFTAHPTENKRRTVLSKLRRIARALNELDRPDLLLTERKQLKANIHAEVTSLWTTERNRTHKPTVNDEIRTGIFHFYATLWQVIPHIYDTLAVVLARYYPNLSAPERFLSFGTWIGGDRDGNPFVTTEASAEALQRYRRAAAEQHSRVMHTLSRSLSTSERLVPVSPELIQLLETYRPHFSDHVARISRRYPSETYRIITTHLAEQLDAVQQEDVIGQVLGRIDAAPSSLPNREALLSHLNLIDASLRLHQLDSLAEANLKDFFYQVQVFGLHTARLDIRQYSAYNRAVLDELLRRLGYVNGYAQQTPAERTALLTRLFDEPVPELEHLPGLSAEVTETVALFKMLSRVVELYGSECLGPYVISMTQGPDDLLTGLLLAYWTGLCLSGDDRPEGLAFAPLFETRADLQAAPEIMAGLFEHPVYARHLARLNRRQIIMIGYSDSNKDAGYISATWELFCAQKAIADKCQAYQINLTLFHGRGGTIARGGGPTNRAILAQPADSVNGQIRITEQGEVIDERYGNPAIARRHLEQLIHAVLMRSAPDHKSSTIPSKKWQAIMETLSETSLQAYRRLVYETPEAMVYWQQATPINEISQLQIGSRPTRRAVPGGDPHDLLAGLRAIPWVFSWMQSRHGLPGWYGLGQALEHYARPEARLANLQEMYHTWPFFKTAIDNAQVSLGKADMGIARLYADLVQDVNIREKIFQDIYEEYQRTCHWILQVTGQAELLDNEPVLKRSIQLRNPYVDPLNFIQVSLLREWRALDNQASARAQSILQAILLTINGIAAGLKNTG